MGKLGSMGQIFRKGVLLNLQLCIIIMVFLFKKKKLSGIAVSAQ